MEGFFDGLWDGSLILPNAIARAIRPVAISCKKRKKPPCALQGGSLHMLGDVHSFPVAVILVMFLNASSFLRYSSMPLSLSSSLPPV